MSDQECLKFDIDDTDILLWFFTLQESIRKFMKNWLAESTRALVSNEVFSSHPYALFMLMFCLCLTLSASHTDKFWLLHNTLLETAYSEIDWQLGEGSSGSCIRFTFVHLCPLQCSFAPYFCELLNSPWTGSKGNIGEMRDTEGEMGGRAWLSYSFKCGFTPLILLWYTLRAVPHGDACPEKCFHVHPHSHTYTD